MLEDLERYNRISRVKLKHIANKNKYQQVPLSSNIFFRINKNKSIISNQNSETNSKHLSDESEIYSQSKSVDLKNHSEHSLRLSRKSSQSVQKTSKFYKITRQISPNKSLPEIKSNQKTLKGKLQKPSQLSNFISGTKVGSLSTRQILKLYELKRIKEEIKKKQFLDNHVKNLKPEDLEYDSDYEHFEKKIPPTNLSGLYTVSSNSSKSLTLSQSQQKLLKLLQNRLSDEDYIEYNVRLLGKMDNNKRRYFERYHNILKRQRQEFMEIN